MQEAHNFLQSLTLSRPHKCIGTTVNECFLLLRASATGCECYAVLFLQWARMWRKSFDRPLYHKLHIRTPASLLVLVILQ